MRTSESANQRLQTTGSSDISGPTTHFKDVDTEAQRVCLAQGCPSDWNPTELISQYRVWLPPRESLPL